MMRSAIRGLALMLALPPCLRAQQPRPQVTFAIYYDCDPSREVHADAIMREKWGPFFDQQVANQKLTSWGWLTHVLGARWRRGSYFVGSSRAAVLDARNAAGNAMGAIGDTIPEFDRICYAHEDYMWAGVAASTESRGTQQQRPGAAYELYFECAPDREARADTLTQQAFAPIFDRHVKAGELTRWSWHRQVLGGKYRRMLAFDGARPNALLQISDRITSEIANERAEESREFTAICPSHQDQVWFIQISRPEK